jgi:hypothetical protein
MDLAYRRITDVAALASQPHPAAVSRSAKYSWYQLLLIKRWLWLGWDAGCGIASELKKD